MKVLSYRNYLAPPASHLYSDGPLEDHPTIGTHVLVPTNAEFPEMDGNLLFNLEPSTIPKVGRVSSNPAVIL